MTSPIALTTAARDLGHAAAAGVAPAATATQRLVGQVRDAATQFAARLSGPAQAAHGPRLLITHVDDPNKLSVSVRHVAAVARTRGYGVTVARAEDLSVRGSQILHQGRPIGPVDGVVVRGGAEHTDEALRSLRAIEGTGVRMTNTPGAIERVSDKGIAAEVLHARNIPHPPSAAIRPGTPDEVRRQVANAIHMLGTDEIVLKPTTGKGGAGVMFLNQTSEIGLRSIADTVMPLTGGHGLLAQKWLTEGTGRDNRVYVSMVNGKLVASPIGLERIAAEGMGAANVAKGGTSNYVSLTKEMQRQAIDAADALGVKFGAVDFIDGPTGKQVVEVNTSPGVSNSVARKLQFDQTEQLLDYAVGA